MKTIRSIILVLFCLVFVDRFVFDFLIWKLSNESAWSTNYFHNTMYELKRLKNRNSSKPLILVVGSSIAYYSIDKVMLSKYLFEKVQREFDVEYISYAGMTPLDSFLLSNEIIELKPSLVLFPVNFIDIRLHRAYVLNPKNRNDSIDDVTMIRDALHFPEAPQSKYLFPFSSLLEFGSILSLEQNAQYLASVLFSFYRYREIFFTNIKNFYQHRWGRNISYHAYNGVQIPERVNSLGWTGQKFSFLPVKYMVVDGFFVQVVPELVKEKPLVINIYNSQKKVSVSFATSGWKKIQLDSEFLRMNEYVTVELSHTWSPFSAAGDRFDYSFDLMGVRLQQTFGLFEHKSDVHFIREERSEDIRYISMDDKEYEKLFHFRLLSDLEKRPGILYITDLKKAKERLTLENFQPTMHLKYLRKFTEKLSDQKIRTLVVNNPENPLSLSWYVHSRWYKDHLDYLNTLNGQYVKFIDYHSYLRMQDFSDFHHFVFPAVQKMNSIYGEEIIRFLALP